jgi:hypothetical protein
LRRVTVLLASEPRGAELLTLAYHSLAIASYNLGKHEAAIHHATVALERRPADHSYLSPADWHMIEKIRKPN